jgi:two-component system sensor histidine kinase KdpD
MTTGTLRVYLGAAPGVGKTFAMLNEGWRRRERGADVVVAYVETHGRTNTAEQLRDLENIPRSRSVHRGAELEEMDLDAVLARRPDVALVDELAHTNAPGCRHTKRWEDVIELLEAGIDVITTVNVQHLASLTDVVQRITGTTQRETVPDEVVRRADQIELVDMSPEALRRRMAHGNIYPAERIDAALGNYFRPGNLAALRELALLWLADRVEDALRVYMDTHGIDHTWETRERVVVALTGAPGGERLIRRASRIARRVGGELLGVHVAPADGLAANRVGDLESHRRILSELGGSYHEVVGADVAEALARFAEAERATQLVLGASRQTRARAILHGSVVNRVLQEIGEIDVHVISEGASSPEERVAHLPQRRRSLLSVRRRLAGIAIPLVTLPPLTAVLAGRRADVHLDAIELVFLLVVIAASGTGGGVVGLVTAVAASLLINWYFVEPLHTFTIAEAANLFSLFVFVTVAAIVAGFVGRAARRSLEAGRARNEASALARTTASLVGERDPLPSLVAQLRETFGLQAAAVLVRTTSGWSPVVSSGEPVPTEPPADGSALALSDEAVLVLVGHDLAADDWALLRAFAAQLAVALSARRLAAEADAASSLAATNELRTALLRSVSHDLRSPLAAIKADVTGLLATDVHWTAEATRDALLSIDAETDRLNRLVGNLLDMSRLQSGAVTASRITVGADEIISAALASLSGLPPGRVDVDVDGLDGNTLADTDPALIERALANVVSNALAWSPEESPVLIKVGATAGRVEIRVMDRGPGIPAGQREKVFEPFQRLGDRSRDIGVGLGLAIAKGFVEATGGTLELDDTPGGGTTVCISLPSHRVQSDPTGSHDPSAAGAETITTFASDLS